MGTIGTGATVRGCRTLGPVRTDPRMPQRLFHVAEAEQWEAARAGGRYEGSTRGMSLAQVGFVHLATAEQWPGVLERD